MDIAVLGGGSWGTTLADLLARRGNTVRQWVRDGLQARMMARERVNERYLPGARLCPSLGVSSDIAEVMQGAACVLVAVPSQFVRDVLSRNKHLFSDRPIVVCASKGVENGTLKPLSRVVAESLEGKSPRYAILSGPSFAKEVIRRLPTAVSLGCEDRKLAHLIRDVFSTDQFRVYTTPDFKGVEIGGAVKNIMAIGAGLSDGLGSGHDARAALITRGLAEMSRLGEAMGAQERTFMGLSGMGDLVLTCTGDLSRNRRVGLELGQGKKLGEILAGMHMVAEGVRTTRSVYGLGVEYGIELPITEQVYKVLYADKDPRTAVQELMSRQLKDE
ncbi:NAD(P)H-dependent glycerol-3-phosphate dehydrogenase [Desulfoplanes sp.]